jgi:alpha-beta hydrolase superfamily lysophospholipase
MSKPTIVLGIHGLGGHSGWFKNLKDELLKHNISFVAYDLPGFGDNHMLGCQRSSFIKGHVDSYKEWIGFIQDKYRDLQQNNPDSRIVLFGHSLGSVILSCLELPDDQIIVLSVPGFKGGGKTFDPIFTIMTLKKVLIDKMILDNNVFVEMPVSEKSRLTPAFDDPLRVGSVTQTLLFEVLKMGEIAKKKILEKKCPCYFIQMTDDVVVDNKTQDLIYSKLAATHKQKHSYADVDHDWIWDMHTTKKVTNDLVEWLDRF